MNAKISYSPILMLNIFQLIGGLIQLPLTEMKKKHNLQ